MSKKLAGKVAVVTGASKGIGAAIAKNFGDSGASVVVNYASSKEGAQRVVDEIVGNGSNAIAVQADCSKPADVQRLFAETKTAFGRVDVLVNNAGIYQFAPLEQITPEHFHKIYDLNVLGLLLCTQEAVKLMGSEGGSVINISSVVSTHAVPFSAVYSSSKGAVDSITRVLAKELGGRKIRVNSINPGLVETEGVLSSALAHQTGEIAKTTMLGRVGVPQDIAPAAVYLASSDSSWMTGETFYISGGLH